MSTALATQNGPIDAAVVENVLLKGDLRQLNSAQKIAYYNNVCASIGLNPLTQPFAFIVLNGKEVLYAKKDATEQLRKIHNISIAIPAREVIEGVYVVTARASMPSGRQDESTGAVTIDGLKGESRANAMLKAETKAKRRVTLSICGMGMLDETEVEDIPQPPLVTVQAVRVELPAGACQLVRVEPKSLKGATWADVTFVNDKGEEKTLPTQVDNKDAAASVCEALLAEKVPVVIESAPGPRGGKERITKIGRWKSPEQVENERIDAELAAKEAEAKGQPAL